MTFVISDSDLWKKALGHRDSDAHEVARTSLRSALLKMRTAVTALISEIPADCKGLTIHDITHLDALWEMADLIAGSDYDLNPVEAFVFGCSVLLHDAALTFIAYPGGLAAIKDTVIWKDLEAAQERQNQLEDQDREIDYDSIAFEVLRRLHAQQSENLATQSWPVGPKDDRIYLLEDSDLRMSYGRSIGRIARSHHWSIDKVAEELRDDVGASPSLPKEWTLSERKIACLLRCADIAHLDRRRAPTILLASKSLSDTSKPHWEFQNKINKPVLRDEALHYSSGESFKLSENEAWWLAYDVLRSVDSEIRNSNALLSEQRFPKFAAQRVAGAETPRSLAKLVTTDGWRPVDTEIRVTDPIHLARTLGGSNLYGDDSLAPIRELIQNAVDAIRARRRLEHRSPTWGKIFLTIDQDDQRKPWLTVDDNGIGMSERVLTGPLVDFGKSLWTSSILQEEFPGLQSEGITPVGKFGIGFFSIFLLGQRVSVTTSKIRSTDNIKTLEFNGIGKRPVLRDASTSEVRLDFTTRIKVQLNDANILTASVTVKDSTYTESSKDVPASDALVAMISCLDVDVEIRDNINDIDIVHAAAWTESTPKEFFVLSNFDGRNSDDVEYLSSIHSEMLSVLQSDDGVIYGRAALNLVPGSGLGSSFCRLSVGGFVNIQSVNHFDFYVGTMSARTNVASRATAYLDVPRQVLSDWASSQVQMLDKSRIHPVDQLTVCHNVLRVGGDSGSLPFCLGSSGLLTAADFRAKLSSSETISLPIVYASKEYRRSDEKTFEHMSLSKLANQILFYKLKEDFIVIAETDNDLFYDDMEESEVRSKVDALGYIEIDLEKLYYRGELQALLLEVRRAWGNDFRVKLIPNDFIDMKTYRDTEERWALTFERVGKR